MPDSSNRQQDRLSTLVPSASIPALPRASTIAVIDPQASAFGYEHRRPDWPWIMVPEGETRTLTLGINAKDPVVLNGPAPDGTVELLHMNRCHVKLNGMRLQIRGMQSTRNIPIDLYQPGRYLRVWVSVKSRLDVHIIAHYVEHGPLLKTRISKEQPDFERAASSRYRKCQRDSRSAGQRPSGLGTRIDFIARANR